MDTELLRYLEGMEGRLAARQAGVEDRLTGLEDRLTGLEARMTGLEARMTGLEARLDEMETRLMTRINDNQEAVLVRVRNLEAMATVHTELARNTNNLLETLTSVSVDLLKRVTDLEKKPRT